MPRKAIDRLEVRELRLSREDRAWLERRLGELRIMAAPAVIGVGLAGAGIAAAAYILPHAIRVAGELWAAAEDIPESVRDAVFPERAIKDADFIGQARADVRAAQEGTVPGTDVPDTEEEMAQNLAKERARRARVEANPLVRFFAFLNRGDPEEFAAGGSL